MPDNAVQALATEYLSRLRNGETVSIEDYADQHPDLAAEIRTVFPSLVRERSLEPLGDFELVREIGRGGMGVVYEAQQQSLGRRVALKVLPQQALSNRAALERFLREAQVSGRLHHTNIVPIFGTGEHRGQHYYVMQLIRGLGLDKVIEALRGETERAGSRGPSEITPQAAAEMLLDGGPKGGMPFFRSVARIGMQVADAVQYAHEKGTLHRDIKPANLLLNAHGTVWVTDFGLAKALEQEDLTGSGDIVGTLRYMSPEQTQGRFDARSDIYAIGLTLYELASLRPAFGEGGANQLLRKIADGELQSLQRLDPSVPDDLATIVDKACARDPRHRYPTAKELGEDLERFIEDRPIHARRVTTVETLWRWGRRNRAMAVLAAATILVVLAAGVGGWIGWGITTSALKRESAESQRAEANLMLSLQAFEDVFDQVSGPDLFQSVIEDPDTGDFAVVAGSTVSSEDIGLLERLLAFYGQFAEQNAENTDLQWEAAKAHRRVGDIRQQLGEHEAAADAYRAALGIYEALGDAGPERAAEVAVAHNELGRVLLAQGDGPEAVDAHEAALRILTDGGEDGSPVSQLELARTHNLLGEAMRPSGRGRITRGRGGRRGGRRVEAAADPVREQHEAALQIVDALVTSDPDNPEYRLAEALSHRLLAARAPDRQTARSHLSRAVSVLGRIVEVHPQAEHYRLELAKTLMSGTSARTRSAQERAAQRAAMVPWLRQAVSVCEGLYKDNPSVPEYAVSLARARFLLGGALDGPEADELMVQGWEMDVALIGDSPNAVLPFTQLGLMVATLVRRLQPADAERLLELALQSWEDRAARTTRQTVYSLRSIYGQLGDVREALGDRSGAEDARARAATLGRGRRR